MNALFLAVAFAGWAFWAFACKMVAMKLHPIWMQFSSYGLGFLCFPIFWYLLKQDKPVPLNMSGVIWAIIGGASGIIAYLFYTLALKTTNIGTASVVVSCYPILTFILAAIFLGETVTTMKIAGIISIIIGVVLLGR